MIPMMCNWHVLEKKNLEKKYKDKAIAALKKWEVC